jgi:hypothetical protein
MHYTCLYVPGGSLVYSGKSPLQTAADINFCDEARSLGAVRSGVCFPLWPGCTGRELPSLPLARYLRCVLPGVRSFRLRYGESRESQL